VAVIEDIPQPQAYADVTWVPPEEGGRRSGPPTATVYAATTVFTEGDEAEVQPGWPGSADQLSILLQRTGGPAGYKVGFLAPDLARPHLHPGAEFLVLEGPKVVGHGVVREVPEP
jgi:hypothetical protein